MNKTKLPLMRTKSLEIVINVSIILLAKCSTSH